MMTPPPHGSGWTIETLKEHWETIHERDQNALRLQAVEYERRLDALNNEHARIAKAQATYVSYSVLATVISICIAVAAIYYRH